jgi:hypothetical protein
MRAFKIIQRVFTRAVGLASPQRITQFACGDCERWQRCGLPPHSDCIPRAAQIARDVKPRKRFYLPAC